MQNTALFGGAIFSFRDEERYLRDCDFEGNSAFVAGVMYASRGTLNVRGSTFKHNTASRDNGGALYISGLQYDLQSSQFIGNFADDDGGAIYGRGINGNISDCLFEDNIAGFDGGAIDGLTATDVLDSNFTNNTALGCGAMCASVTTLRGCRFEENSAKQGYGGAIRGDFKNVQECYFKGNKASRARFGGGAIDGLIINLQNSLFESNEAGGGGGALRMPRDTRISTYIKGCQFSDNRAVDGGAIDLYDITTVLMEDVEFKGRPSSCTCIPSTPITCPLQSRAGAKARADQDGPHDMEELLKTLHEKQELMFAEMLLQLNSTNASSPAEDDDQESESEELELILEKYGIQIQP